MATRSSKTAMVKLSFASVAAMAPPTPKANPTIIHDDKGAKSGGSPAVPTAKMAPPGNPSAAQLNRELQGSISRLNIKENLPTAKGLSEQEAHTTLRSSLKFEDDKTHLSSSSTKPTSLDGKSVTSGTTFAMDEKESLRPDDSASVKAAEDDDAYSGPASGATSSRVGSEAGSRAFRDQFYEISERIGPGTQRGTPLSRQAIPGIEEEGPQNTLAPIITAIPVSAAVPRPEVLQASGASFSFNYQEPDEKLFEALESPKDRLFLLRLEQEVITFVKDSQEPILDLPPCNSFCRLLAHKLADYYALTHFVDNAVSAVRLYRTPYCRLPTPLSAITKPSAATELPVSAQPAVKIMRRAGLGKDGQTLDSGVNTAGSSMAPSKAGSETGDESQRGTGIVSPSDSVSAKDKTAMTREEREAKYKETRERIFKGFEDTDATDAPIGTDVSNEVSRTSSAAGKRKSRKNKNIDDGFEARSQFNAYYPSMQYPHTTFDQVANQMAFVSPYTMQPASQTGQFGMPQAYNQSFQVTPHVPGFPMTMQQPPLSGGSSPYGHSSMPHQLLPYGQQMPSQFYQPLQQPNLIGSQSSALSSPALSSSAQLSRPHSQMPEQQWPQGGYQSPYQAFGNQQLSYNAQNQAHIQGIVPISSTPNLPYPYGQLPYHQSVPNGRPQHPLPGSFNRQAFNPQTRAFVPATGSVPPHVGLYMNGPMDLASYGARPGYQGGNGVLPYSQPGSFAQVPPLQTLGQHNYAYNATTYGPRKSSGQAAPSQSPGQSSLSKWGTPATLPPKPPPPEVPNISGTLGIPNMNGGHGMPTFQNGTYSQPRSNT